VEPKASSRRTAEERAELKRRKKNTPSHYRERLDRLRQRAEFLKRLIASKPEPERTWGRERAEISALEWAVATLEPWFAKEEPQARGVDGGHPTAFEPEHTGKPKRDSYLEPTEP
jgi:hypothetical protein